MKQSTRDKAVMFVVTYVLALGWLTLNPDSASAGQIEGATRSTDRNYLTYAEPMPTERFPNRHYFELHDGSTFIYVTYGSCDRANTVPNRVCKTVFWYAR